jgi:predicted 3-demethylubiquinone-9 3-methyltransferase (glyoxalase superfamily)
MPSKPFTTCLWFDTKGEDAANFYAGIFKDSKITAVHRYGEAGPGPEGAVMTVAFELNGQRFLALNGGPQYQFSAAVSLVIECADQDEVDYYWDRLTDGGQEVACGWVTDKFGFSWQVVPSILPEMLGDPDPARAARVTEAMLKSVKFDIAALRAAYDGV